MKSLKIGTKGLSASIIRVTIIETSVDAFTTLGGRISLKSDVL